MVHHWNFKLDLSFFIVFRYNESLPVETEGSFLMPVASGHSTAQLSAGALAFVGDAVFALFIRERTLMKTGGSAHRLHLLSTSYVKASAQSRIVRILMEELDEEEQAVFRRGRNAHSATMPKNANVQDYRHATGFEALLGYLHLAGRQERLAALMERSASIIEEDAPDGNGR